MEEFIEDNNLSLEQEEALALLAIMGVIELEFNRLLPQVFAQVQNGLSPIASREEVLLELIPELPVDPSKDPIQKSVEQLLKRSSTLGLDLSSGLSSSLVPAPVAASVSAALLVEAAARTRGYIGIQAKSFSESVSGAVSGGLFADQSPSDIRASMKRSLKTTRARIDTILITEAARARYEAADTYFAQQGINLVWYYAQKDERTCPHCAAMAGKVFKRTAIKLPRHYRCRCTLQPYKKNESDKNNAVVDRERRVHRRDVLRYARDKGVQLNEGPAAFEHLRPISYGKDA